MAEETLKPWLEQVEESLRGHEALSEVENVNDLTKRFISLGETKKAIEGDLTRSIRPLGEKPTEEELSNFRKAMGIPEKPEGYQIEKTQAEGIPYDELLEKKFRETAHQMHFTPAQVAGLYKMYQDYQIGLHSEIVKSVDENRQKAVDTLKNIWPGDSYKENSEKAVRSFHKFLEVSKPPEALGGEKGIKEWFETNGIGDDPVVMWFFSKVFDLIGDDRFIRGTPAGGPVSEKGMLDFSKSMK